MENENVVIFDVYKTLINIKTDEENFKTYEFIADWLAYKGLRINPKDLFNLYKKITKEEYESNAEPYPDIDIGNVFKKIIYDIDKTKIDTRDEILIKEISSLFRILTTKSLNILPDSNFVLQSLHNKVRLAIVSNTQRLFTMGELFKYDLIKYFEYILFSSDVKVCKPNPKIFLKALDELKIKPHNAIYVGDNIFDDVWGAQKVGLKTVWINHGNLYNLPKINKMPTPDAEVKINDYSELPKIILSMI
ncbi:(S)-2-haloacid dehalogenase 4A [bacterium BMS3Abin03]|nr:(S)-2-haloacid dehalogenase 4A [bacterium BMS3Abin03]